MSKLGAAMGEDLPKIIGILRERAMDGDMRAIDLVMSRCLGPLRAADPTITLPLTGNPGEDARIIAQAAGRGEISPSTAQQLMGAVALVRPECWRRLNGWPASRPWRPAPMATLLAKQLDALEQMMGGADSLAIGRQCPSCNAHVELDDTGPCASHRP